MQTTDEIKEWQTQSVKHKVAGVLMMDGVSFRYDEENGITFTVPGILCGKAEISTCHGFWLFCKTDYKRNK